MPVLSANEPDTGSGNFIRALDVRTRMLICLLVSVGIVFVRAWYPLSLIFAASFIYVAAHGSTRVIWASYGVVLVLFVVSFFCIELMVRIWPELGDEGISTFVNPFLRVLVLLNVILALAVSGRIGNVMNTLRSLRLPFFIYLPATVMIRFIPSFINDVKQINQSMKTKGYHLNIVSMTLHPLLTLRLMFVPVVIRALRSSDELSVAAELKGLGYSSHIPRAGRSDFGPKDAVALVYAGVLMGISLV